MLSLKQCNEVLNRNSKKYSEEQVKAIREHLYFLADIIKNVKINSNEEV